MIDYLSDYRTQDKLKGKHYYPKGALCWFSCDQYGDFTGSVYVIKLIPDMKLLDLSKNLRGYRQLMNRMGKVPRLNEILSKDNPDTDSLIVVKPKLHKYSKGEK
jgi:hypothetical protein